MSKRKINLNQDHVLGGQLTFDNVCMVAWLEAVIVCFLGVDADAPTAIICDILSANTKVDGTIGDSSSWQFLGQEACGSSLTVYILRAGWISNHALCEALGRVGSIVEIVCAEELLTIQLFHETVTCYRDQRDSAGKEERGRQYGGFG